VARRLAADVQTAYVSLAAARSATGWAALKLGPRPYKRASSGRATSERQGGSAVWVPARDRGCPRDSAGSRPRCGPACPRSRIRLAPPLRAGVRLVWGDHRSCGQADGGGAAAAERILIRVLHPGLFPQDHSSDLRERCTAGDRCEPLDSDGMWTKRGPTARGERVRRSASRPFARQADPRLLAPISTSH